MDEPIDPNKIASPAAGISVPVGGVEGVPVSIEAPFKAPEASIEVKPSEVEPVISEEEKEAGVVAHPTQPILHPDAKAAGIVESIPSHPNFNPPVFKSVQDAEQVANTTPETLSLAWIAEIIAKNLKRFKPQEVN